jgi:hypothetical protein
MVEHAPSPSRETALCCTLVFRELDLSLIDDPDANWEDQVSTMESRVDELLDELVRQSRGGVPKQLHHEPVQESGVAAWIWSTVF